jgi:predicted DNA-binding transcriptional regulator YafY
MLVLQSRGRMTASDLAERLEVSERTVYRDLDALSAAGVPIYAQPGTNGGIFLDEDYRISLTGLSRQELTSLFVSSDAGPLKDIGLDRAVEESLLKLLAALPSVQRREVERMRQRLYVDPADWFQKVEPVPFLPLLQQAVWEDRIVEAVYQRAEMERASYTLEAHALVAKANIWYLVGKVTGREMHTYRVARFEEVSLTDARFERTPDFDLEAFWKASCREYEEEMKQKYPAYTATVRVHTEALWLFYAGLMADRYEQIGGPDEESWVTLRAVYPSIENAVMKVLGLGPYIRVVEPETLRRWVIETARAVLIFNDAVP